MATYNYGQLESLWQKAGGNPGLAPVMAAIALAESGGHTGAVHHDSDGSTDYGLWQINSVHGYNKAKLLGNPLYNAKAAVAVERSSGLGAWSTYKNGGYKKYLPGGTTTSGQWGLPYNPNDSKVGRIDQGIDITSSSPFVAVGSGTVVHIDPNFYNGTPAVYLKLDRPVTVNGHSYDAVYYAETRALVHVGQRVAPGQPVSGPGNGEIGFARKFGSSSSSWLPAAHGQYTEGHPTQAGSDFAAAIKPGGGSGGHGLFSNPFGSGNVLGGVGSAVGGAAHAVASPFEAVNSFLGLISSGAFWIRAGEVIGGGLFILLGLYLLVKQVGLTGFDVPVPAPAKQAADNAADTTTNSPEPRPRVINQYYLDTPTGQTRRARALAARGRERASDEVPF